MEVGPSEEHYEYIEGVAREIEEVINSERQPVVNVEKCEFCQYSPVSAWS